jgi:hypothetical protein
MPARASSPIESRKRGEGQQAERFERAAFDGERGRICGSSLDARSGNSPLRRRYRVVSVVAASSARPSRVGRRLQTRQPLAPIGVSAKVPDASTIRSNSRPAGRLAA